MEIKIEVKKASIDRIRKAPEEMRNSLIPAMKKCMAIAEATSKTQYLSGPRPQKLDRRTGRLRGSVSTATRRDADKIIGEIGTNVVYARIHEMGFNGTVGVSSHVRRTKTGKSATVRAHARRLYMRKRPFLRPAIEDNIEKFKTIFRDAVIAAFGE